jgi:DNA-directed RNA polymerase II subunit RPB2
MDEEKISWEIIDTYFKDNPYNLVKHQLESYNDFLNNGIKQIFREKNPVKLSKEQNENNEFKYNLEMYFGGKNGNKIYYGKPIIYDQENRRSHYMYPNEARLRNMTYGLSIHYDVDVYFKILDEDGNVNESMLTLNKIFLGRFPIMLQSDLCVLQGMDPEIRFNMGECRNDPGGYFIIDGKEKVIVSQEKFADNMVKFRSDVSEHYSHAAEIRSVSEDASKPIRNFSVRIARDTNQIVIVLGNVRKPIPLFILMRALGVISDKEIIKTCLLDLEKNEDYIELFRPSIYEAAGIYTQQAALDYIKTFTKNKTIPFTLNILMDLLFPHMGELNFKEKALFLGNIVKRLLRVFTKEDKPTDRDSFKYKRVEVTGTLLYDLFKEYYNLQQKNIFSKMDNEYYFKKNIYNKDFVSLIENNYFEFFKERVAETGFKKAFKGNWGAQAYTKRMGIVQDLNRLSFNSFISQLRKLNLDMDSSAKVIGPRLLNSTQWGIIDPLDTPDGGNVGLHKHLAMSTHITSGFSGLEFIKFFKQTFDLKILEECSYDSLDNFTKVFVNGAWIGIVEKPENVMVHLRFLKRNGAIPLYTSIQWDYTYNEIYISTDEGRLIRPLIYLQNNKANYKRNETFLKKIANRKYTWQELVQGFVKKEKGNGINVNKIYKLDELYTKENIEKLKNNSSVLEYIDTQEAESLLLETKEGENKLATHIEIHPSLILGVMGNQIVFPENNQLPRNLFSCGQSKQGVSLYNTNYQNRIDKMGVILNYGQIPLTKTRYLKYINREQQPYGENAIVAIACYSGYNVEDAVLINKGSLDRGFFRTTYFNMYESTEQSSSVATSDVDSHFLNIKDSNVIRTKPGYDYNYLDEYGVIKENTVLNDKIVIIGKGMKDHETPDTYIDDSTVPKKGQLGIVDKAFITDDEQGFRLAKVRIREERIPTLGDKVCSRCGQKGTIGMIIREEDMPYTANGLKPDIIINPHALPSRMTIGQLIESLMGKACSLYGGFGDCTAFVNKGLQSQTFGEMLTNEGFHSSGNEVLYNGMTGEQLETEIFIGPTYYMRLKHMVKDKINYRARGPRTGLTRQTVHGRAKDGGLRIGEMERDGIIAHGMTDFLKESMLVRGDDYYMAVCNTTGTIAVYNESRNLFLSPNADGPIKFDGTLEDTLNVVNVSKYGRDFSIVRVPYSFKLLLQEIKTMNIQMRIITEDNVDQLTNLSYSTNYKSLNINFDSPPKKEEPELEPEPEPKLEPELEPEPEPITQEKIIETSKESELLDDREKNNPYLQFVKEETQEPIIQIEETQEPIIQREETLQSGGGKEETEKLKELLGIIELDKTKIEDELSILTIKTPVLEETDNTPQPIETDGLNKLENNLNETHNLENQSIASIKIIKKE